MNFSRRDFGFLLPAFAAAGVATAQTPALPSKTYAFDDLPVQEQRSKQELALFSTAIRTEDFPVETAHHRTRSRSGAASASSPCSRRNDHDS